MIERNLILRTGFTIVVLLLMGMFLTSVLRSGEKEDTWQVFKPLVGEWKGDGAGFGDVTDVTHLWDLVLQGKYLRLRTKSVSRKEGKSVELQEEIHEDVGFLSWDTDRKSFVFRQFLSEGFINTFDVTINSEKPLMMIFGHRETESGGGMRAQMTLSFTGDTKYDMVLDLAGPGKEFSPCQQIHMKKKQ